MEHIRHVPQDDEGVVSELHGLLGNIVRVHLDDGRRVTGVFKCVDGDRNFVLGDAQEVRPVEEVDGTQHPDIEMCNIFGLMLCLLKHLEGGAIRIVHDDRSLGSVMVPGVHIERVEVTSMSWVDLLSSKGI